ncbi:MAG: rhodanese-like domain-containing protein [Akkermansiaceae bacterium]|nr:rhodanese-like domain-containing protein [Akkermansiaceae bacterium]
MTRAAVTFLAPIPLLAVLSCTGAQREAGDVTGFKPSSGLKVSAEADETPVTPGAGRVTRIMLGDLFKLQQENRVLIFDVRPAFLYQLGHIPGAVSWPKAGFDSQLPANEARIAAARAAKKPVVVYCVDFACPDARTVATWLSERGHSTAVLEGGWDAWKTGGLPAE